MRTDIAGLAPQTKYFYRLVARNASGTVARQAAFIHDPPPAARRLARRDPNPVKAADSTTTSAAR